MIESKAMSTREDRAAHRRATWSGGKVSSFQAIEELDEEQSEQISPAARLGLVWSLVEDSLALGGYRGPAPRLQRSVGGVRPLRG